MRNCPICLTPTENEFCSNVCAITEQHREIKFFKLSREGQRQVFDTHINIVGEDRYEEGNVL